MLEVTAKVPRSVQLNTAIMGIGLVADSRASLVYNSLRINEDRFKQALQRVCGEVIDPSSPDSSILEPGTPDYIIFLGSLSSTASQRKVKRESAGFPLGSWKGKEGKDGKIDGERKLFFIPGFSDDLPYFVIDIKDPKELKRIGTIRLRKEGSEYVAEYSGDPRLIPENFRPNFSAVAKLTNKIPLDKPVQINDLPLQFITQAALEQLGI